MKLRNKKTGEILEEVRSSMDSKDRLRIYDMLNDEYYTYNTLAELNEEWEDYEEPKEQFYIDCDGRIFENHTTEYIKGKMQEIGNYFETNEEAEKAVEKLKAWKRLKDKGFRFNKWNNDTQKYLGDFIISAQIKNLDNIIDDLDLLFGGEE